MIKEIIIRDFFSFKNTQKIKLNTGVNLLLGINGSGKTSFLNAFKLLYEGVAGEGFEALFQEQWGGFNQVGNSTSRQAPYSQITYIFDHKALKRITPQSPFESDVHYTISISPSGSTSYSLRERLCAPKKGKNGEMFIYLDFKNGTGKISTRDKNGGNIRMDTYNEGDISGQELVLRQVKDPLRYLPSHTIRKAIESMSIYGYFNTDSKSKLRFPNEFSSYNKLRRSGDNLAHLLSSLKNNRTLVYETIEKELTKINPYFKSIEFTHFGSQLYLALREKDLDKTIPALHLSDGTLRYLLYMSIFFNPDRGSFLSIDEPECGLHPDMIKSIADMIKSASNGSQIIVASHSPLLFNHFELEDILIFEKSQENATQVKRVVEADFPGWEGDCLPGQMWLRGLIGGKRW